MIAKVRRRAAWSATDMGESGDLSGAKFNETSLEAAG
jgi:hypothetical protein